MHILLSLHYRGKHARNCINARIVLYTVPPPSSYRLPKNNSFIKSVGRVCYHGNKLFPLLKFNLHFPPRTVSSWLGLWDMCFISAHSDTGAFFIVRSNCYKEHDGKWRRRKKHCSRTFGCDYLGHNVAGVSCLLRELVFQLYFKVQSNIFF